MNNSLYTLLIIVLFAAPTSAFSQKADILIVNAKVITMSEPATAEAIAIAGNRILAVGSVKDLMKLKRSTTQVIDAKGKTIIPGLVDSHLHVIRGGRFYNTELR